MKGNARMDNLYVQLMSINSETSCSYRSGRIHRYLNTWVGFEETLCDHLWVVGRKLDPGCCQTLPMVISAHESRQLSSVEVMTLASSMFSPLDEVKSTEQAMRNSIFDSLVLFTSGQPAESTNFVTVGEHPEYVPVARDLEVLLQTLWSAISNASVDKTKVPRGAIMLPNPVTNTAANSPAHKESIVARN